MSWKWTPKRSSFGPQGPFLVGRELGRRSCIGQEDALYRDLYSSYLPCNSWDFGRDSSFGYHGGVFNLEFSPDGKILVAACEQKSFITFDPLTHKPIYCVENAHSDCVNCVRFLDSRTFATCSDDTTIGLWDVRNLRQRITSLKGHSNWVKNIEYAQEEGLLVTSGFDGSVYTWNINNYTENGIVHTRVFHSNGLMRMRLNHDASKMVLCTTNGYLMVIHDLDLNHLAQDLAGFKPNMYRLMQLSRTPIPLAVNSTHLFSSSRNRVELINDFPVGNDAEVISSLQIHPQGWCALSRNTSSDDQSEWTCVHDIQDLPPPSKSSKRNRDVAEECEEGLPKRANISIAPATSGLAPEPVLRIGPNLGNSRSLIDDSLSDSEHDSDGDYEDYESETPSPLLLEDSDPTFDEPGLPRGLVSLRERLVSGREEEHARFSPVIPPLRSFGPSSVVGTVGSNDSIGLPSPDYRNYSPDRELQASYDRVEQTSAPAYPDRRHGSRSGGNDQLDGTDIRRVDERRSVSPMRLHRVRGIVDLDMIRGSPTSAPASPDSETVANNHRVRGDVDIDLIPESPSYAPASPDPGTNSGTTPISDQSFPLHERNDPFDIPEPLRTRPDGLPQLEAETLSAVFQDANSATGPSDRSSSSGPSMAEERQPLNVRRVEEPVRSNLSTRAVQVRIRAPLSWGEGPDGGFGFQLRSSTDPEPQGREIEVRLPSLEILEALQTIRNRRARLRDDNPLPFRVRTSRPLGRPQRRAQSVDISGASTSAVFVQAASDFAARTVIYQRDPRVRGELPDVSSRVRRPRATERSTSYTIHENVPRLTHFREEPNMGRGFIKELCFSADGRLIASPFGNGVRLLAFNQDCSEMSHCMEAWNSSPVKLYELAASMCHTNVVVSTKFSPAHCMLVSGCLNGKIVWHQPIS